ncbi:MAG: polysaccharide pyruvyl transferase family protein [Cyclobacteriaceae bacterium]
MKIGILTYHYVPNFGANLQTLSTLEYLKNHGHNPIVINWQPKSVVKSYEGRVPIIQRNKHLEFLKHYIPMTEICISDDDIINEIKRNQIDAIIVGSDVVLRYTSWRSQFKIFQSRMPLRFIKRTYDVVFPNPFWLNFLTKTSELSKLPSALMSVSSMGSKYIEIPLRVKKMMFKQLKQFKFISVRDSWTREMVKAISLNMIDPKITPDPVFGFNQNVKNDCTRNEILNKYNLPEKYLVISFRNNYINTQWIKEFEILSEEANLKCVELAVPEGTLNLPLKHKIDIPLDPIDWYNIIRYSSGYIGQNMHPIVICIHNCVPFYSFDDYGGNTIAKSKNLAFSPSKIFDLLNHTSFTKNCFNVGAESFDRIDKKEILRIIKNFDFKRCKMVSNELEREYNNMMKKLLNRLEIS